MKMLVVGKSSGSFSDRQTGQEVKYARLFVTHDFPKNRDGNVPENSFGTMAETVKIPYDLVGTVGVGDTVVPVYNQYGKVEDVEVIEKFLDKDKKGA